MRAKLYASLVVTFVFLCDSSMSYAQRWNEVSFGYPSWVYCIQTVDEQTVWMGTSDGVVMRTTDRGLAWKAVKIDDKLIFNSIAAIDENTAFVISANSNISDTRIYKITDGGNAFTRQYRDTSNGAFLNSIAFWDDANGIAVGDPVDEMFVVLVTSNGGEKWNRIALGDDVKPNPTEWAGFGANGGTVLAVAGMSCAWFGTAYPDSSGMPTRVLRTTDRGKTWAVAETPLSIRGQIHGITTIVFSDTLHGFAGGGAFTDPEANPMDTTGFLVRTSDGGVTWTNVTTFPKANPRTVKFVPQTNFTTLVGTLGKNGSALSTNGGDTWRIFDLNPVWALDFSSPTVGWADARQGWVFRFDGDLTASLLRPDIAPRGIRLSQNSPNPFTNSTAIRFFNDHPGEVTLSLYDLLGRKVKTIVNQRFDRGEQTVRFDRGSLTSGLYVCRLVSAGEQQTMIMVIQ